MLDAAALIDALPEPRVLVDAIRFGRHHRRQRLREFRHRDVERRIRERIDEKRTHDGVPQLSNLDERARRFHELRDHRKISRARCLREVAGDPVGHVGSGDCLLCLLVIDEDNAGEARGLHRRTVAGFCARRSRALSAEDGRREHG
jgi:hypothetical protein